MPVEIPSLDNRELVWQAQPRQNVALTCPAFEICYGGTKGCGKTDVLVVAPWEQILYADGQFRRTGRKQRGRWIIFRKNLKNLNDIIQRCQEIYPTLDPAAHWGKVEKRWEFSSGYVVDLAHLDGPDDHQGYNGQEITGFSIDQAEEIEEHVYNFLFMQVRSKDPGMKQLLKILLTTNPGGRYGEWIKRRFYNGCRPHNTIRTQVIETSKGPVETTAAFIPAKLADNKYLAEDGRYEANLMRLPPEMRRMYLEGDWDVVVGARYAHLWVRDKHVIKSFPIPGSWQIKGGLDWGSTAPACFHVAARDHDGNVYFIDELYRPGVTGRTFGEHMTKKVTNQQWSLDRKWTPDDFYILGDRQARASTGADGTWTNAWSGIQSWGFRLFDANKDRIARVEQWSERLTIRANGMPRVFIFGDRCPQLAQVIPQIPTDQKNTDDVDPDYENDHPHDSSGFILMDWPVDHPKNEKGGVDKDVERWLELARRRKMAASGGDEPVISTGYGD